MIVARTNSDFPESWTLDDLTRHLGGISARRIRLHPPPGCAQVKDVVRAANGERPPCELVDGVLVEKVMGWYQSLLGGIIIGWIRDYLREHDLGQVLPADGMLQILPDLVRLPDVAFVSWKRIPKGRERRAAAPVLAPDLAVEILSKGNTKREMARKLKEYFEGGVRLVWYIDARRRTAAMYTAVNEKTEVPKNGTLDGGQVLPGLMVSLRALFAEADRTGPKK